MSNLECKVLIVGAGPGGYVAAIRAGQLGLDTVIVDAGPSGGTCLNRGCIPSKALIHAAAQYETALQASTGHSRLGLELSAAPIMNMMQFQSWKQSVVGGLAQGVDGLLRKSGVRKVQGWARFLDGKTCEVETADGTTRITAEHVVLATGAEPRQLPGIELSARVLDSTGALALERVPEHLAVIGAGYIGLELGMAFRRLGSRVSLIEAQDRILPSYDEELTAPVAAALDALGIDVYTRARLLSCEEQGAGVEITVDHQGESLALAPDYVLINVGRRPQLESLGLENLCLDMDGEFIRIDDRCRTSMRNVWAIGDITGEPQLAHRASAQGIVVAEQIAGLDRRFEPACIPAVCFTEPEIVTVGLSPDQAQAAGYDISVGRHPFKALGRAMTLDAIEGFVRVVARKDNGLVLGMQAVGSHISEFAGEFALAIEMGACLDDLADTIHAHPSLGEGIAEAAMAGLGRAIHW